MTRSTTISTIHGGAAALFLFSVLLSGTALAEGTGLLGNKQDIREETDFFVDILTVGEVINIHAGVDSENGTGTADMQVAGSPFTIKDGNPGWLVLDDSTDIAASLPFAGALQITTTKTGAYKIEFDNQTFSILRFNCRQERHCIGLLAGRQHHKKAF